MKRILLDQKDFEKLTKGEVIQKDDVQIALSDIGFSNMIDIIEKNNNFNYDRYAENMKFIFESEARDIERFCRIVEEEKKTKR